MPRKVNLMEWVGETDDHVPPPRIRHRVWFNAGGKCGCCGRKIKFSEYWQLDHIIALINGGENRERNLQPLCDFCIPDKNAGDVATRSKTFAIIKKNSPALRDVPRRPMMGTKASGWRKRMDGTVERRT